MKRLLAACLVCIAGNASAQDFTPPQKETLECMRRGLAALPEFRNVELGVVHDNLGPYDAIKFVYRDRSGTESKGHILVAVVDGRIAYNALTMFDGEVDKARTDFVKAHAVFDECDATAVWVTR